MFDAEDNESDIDESFDDAHVPDADIQGVIVIQLLTLSQFNDENCSLYDHVYLQLSCSKYMKRTHVMPFFTHKEVSDTLIIYLILIYNQLVSILSLLPILL